MAKAPMEILLIGEDPATCPKCGRRLDVDHSIPVDADRDGPIHRATCLVHGEFFVQDDPETDGPD